jgi:hypothetical protein
MNMPSSNHTAADLGIPYMDTNKTISGAKSRNPWIFNPRQLKTSVQRMFDRTGVRTQPALVRALLSVASPLG